MAADRNRRVFEAAHIGAGYARLSDLLPSEAAILHRYRDDIAGGKILDLGVGGGRTTRTLVDIGGEYLGTDYSKEMIDRCKARFPGVDFAQLDARDLSTFGDDSFDLVMFSFNGIDCVGHEDRQRVFGEVARVLKPRGLFTFSSHNRNVSINKPWNLSNIKGHPLRRPFDFAWSVASYAAGIFNFVRAMGEEREEQDYRIVRDPAHRYSLLLYHIAYDAQVRQLEQAGFTDVEVVARDGRWLSPKEARASEDKWLDYVCRKQSPNAK